MPPAGTAGTGEGPWLDSNSYSAQLPSCCVTLGTSLPSLSLRKKEAVDWSISSLLLALPPVFVTLTPSRESRGTLQALMQISPLGPVSLTLTHTLSVPRPCFLLAR